MVREDESKKAEQELNKLRKLPENKRCANCLAPGAPLLTAVVMPFKIFVCGTCKSAHQSFSHRCKSTQMSLWTMDEVQSLEDRNGGGNRAAQETWLSDVKENDRPRDGDSLERVKDFVRKAYIEERWSRGLRKTSDRNTTSEDAEVSRRHSNESRIDSFDPDLGSASRSQGASNGRDLPRPARPAAARVQQEDLFDPNAGAIPSVSSNPKQAQVTDDFFDPNLPLQTGNNSERTGGFDPNAAVCSATAGFGFSTSSQAGPVDPFDPFASRQTAHQPSMPGMTGMVSMPGVPCMPSAPGIPGTGMIMQTQLGSQMPSPMGFMPMAMQNTSPAHMGLAMGSQMGMQHSVGSHFQMPPQNGLSMMGQGQMQQMQFQAGHPNFHPGANFMHSGNTFGSQVGLNNGNYNGMAHVPGPPWQTAGGGYATTPKPARLEDLQQNLQQLYGASS